MASVSKELTTGPAGKNRGLARQRFRQSVPLGSRVMKALEQEYPAPWKYLMKTSGREFIEWWLRSILGLR
jgi:hypothetical protein